MGMKSSSILKDRVRRREAVAPERQLLPVQQGLEVAALPEEGPRPRQPPHPSGKRPHAGGHDEGIDGQAAKCTLGEIIGDGRIACSLDVLDVIFGSPWKIGGFVSGYIRRERWSFCVTS